MHVCHPKYRHTREVKGNGIGVYFCWRIRPTVAAGNDHPGILMLPGYPRNSHVTVLLQIYSRVKKYIDRRITLWYNNCRSMEYTNLENIIESEKALNRTNQDPRNREAQRGQTGGVKSIRMVIITGYSGSHNPHLNHASDQKRISLNIHPIAPGNEPGRRTRQ